MNTTTTLVLGGGFGGIAAANTLRLLLPEEHDIVVVDKSESFHVGAGKTWIMLGEKMYEDISRPRAELLRPGIRFLQASVSEIDLVNKTVVAQGAALPWTHLVIALGADTDMAAVPGLAEAAHTFYTVAGAQRLRTVLDGFSGGDVVILIPRVPFQCPPAPYEAAMLMHHAFERRGLAGRVRIAIHTVEGAPMTTAGPGMGQYIRSELASRGIGFHPLARAARVDGASGRVVLEDRSEIRFDLLIAVPPHEAPKVVREARLTDASGWIPVDPGTLEVAMEAATAPRPGEVYAIGDVATVPLPGRHKADVPLSLPKAGVFAEAQGQVVARRIAARVLGREADDVFDGKGYCFLELGGGLAVKADGSFFERPHPVMQKRSPDPAQLRDKQEWAARRLRPAR